MLLYVVVIILQQEVEPEVDAPAREAEFANLFQPYAVEMGITKQDIDDELVEAQGRLDKLREKGREETRSGKKVQKQIDDFTRLVALRRLMESGDDENDDDDEDGEDGEGDHEKDDDEDGHEDGSDEEDEGDDEADDEEEYDDKEGDDEDDDKEGDDEDDDKDGDDEDDDEEGDDEYGSYEEDDDEEEDDEDGSDEEGDEEEGDDEEDDEEEYDDKEGDDESDDDERDDDKSAVPEAIKGAAANVYQPERQKKAFLEVEERNNAMVSDCLSTYYHLHVDDSVTIDVVLKQDFAAIVVVVTRTHRLIQMILPIYFDDNKQE